MEDALLFTPYGVFQVAVNRGEFVLRDLPLAGETDLQLAPNTFKQWADPEFMDSEITALWDTWKPALTEEGSYWLVFPVPEEYNTRISTIRLETQDNRGIEYRRFFLGAIRLNRQ